MRKQVQSINEQANRTESSVTKDLLRQGYKQWALDKDGESIDNWQFKVRLGKVSRDKLVISYNQRQSGEEKFEKILKKLYGDDCSGLGSNSYYVSIEVHHIGDSSMRDDDELRDMGDTLNRRGEIGR